MGSCGEFQDLDHLFGPRDRPRVVQHRPVVHRLRTDLGEALANLVQPFWMLPVLGLICMYSGILGGYLVATSNGVPSGVFIQSVQQYLDPSDFIKGMIKTPFFGLIISVVACQQGLRTTNGAVGVGRSTTNAVVIGMVLVYMANFFLAQVLFR